MVDATSEGVIGDAHPATPGVPQVVGQGVYESDFSARKIRVAMIILLGQTFATSILPFIALPLLLVPLTQEFGWTPTQFSYATTSLMIVGAFSALFLGWAVDYVGCRPIIILGTVTVGLVTLGISQINSLFTFCLGFAGLGFFGSTGMVYSKVIAGLFNQNRGKALAIFGAESALAGTITPQIVRYLLGEFGWRETFIIFGCVIIAVAPLLYFFLDEVGNAGGSRDLFKHLKQRKAVKSSVDEPAPTQLEGMSLKQILKDNVFWLILLATLIAGAPRGGLFTYLSPMLTERGFDGQAATANFMSIITFSTAVGALIGGFVLDKFHSAKTAVPFKIMALAALICLGVLSKSFGGFALFAVAGILWGLADGAMRAMGTYFNTRFFGLKAFGGMMGMNTFFFAIFLGVIAPVVGMSQEATGSYQPALWTIAGFLVLGALIYFVLGRYRYGVMVGATKAKPKQNT